MIIHTAVCLLCSMQTVAQRLLCGKPKRTSPQTFWPDSSGSCFSRFRINGRMVARRCCLSYGWPTGPTKNARCEDSGQKRRRGLILVVLECCLYADMYLSAQALLLSADLSGGARGLLGGLKRPGGAWLPGCAAGGDALLDIVFRHCYSSPGMGQLMNGHPYLSRFGG